MLEDVALVRTMLDRRIMTPAPPRPLAVNARIRIRSYWFHDRGDCPVGGNRRWSFGGGLTKRVDPVVGFLYDG